MKKKTYLHFGKNILRNCTSMFANVVPVCPQCIGKLETEIMKVTDVKTTEDMSDKRNEEMKREEKVSKTTWNPFFGHIGEKASKL